MSITESKIGGAPPATAPVAVPARQARSPSDGAAAASGATPGRSPRPMGLPPTSPAQPGSLTRGAGRRSMDTANSRRSTDGGRRSIDGGRRGRHTVEVPEGAERHEGLVVSRQEKFGFIKCSTHEGRYFFHVNDTDGQAAYGSTVSFVIAKDLTTGKDVAYAVRTLAPPAGGPPSGTFTPGQSSAGPASRSSTPDRLASVQASGFFRTSSGEGAEAAGDAAAGAAEAHAFAEGTAAVRLQGAQVAHRSPPVGQVGQAHHEGQQGQHFGRAAYEHFGHHRQHSPATQRDWRLPAREAAFAAAQAERPAGEGLPRRASGAGLSSGGPSPAHSVGGSEAAVPGVPAPLARYRGTVAQVARAGRQHQQDDGLLLYIDENGQQAQARYGNWRLAAGTHRLEPGDVVEFAVETYPGAGAGHRKAAAEVRFLSKGIVHSPSLEALAAAAEQAELAGFVPGAGDPLRGRQLGRIALLKKEFGFIRQMDRPGDMFFHFSQLEGWGPEDIKAGDDVEYIIRRDRNDPNKLSAVQIRRAPPGSVVFEVVSEEVMRGVVLERPTMGKQYGATSGLLEYTPPGSSQPEVPGLPPGLVPAPARLPFTPQDVQQGSGSLRPGDHVTFRITTNLQAAKAAALATVPGAAQYAGKRAVEVAMVRYAGVVAQVNKERQFGFILYGEDQLLPSVPTPVTSSAAGETAANGNAPGAATQEGSGAAKEAAAAEGAPAVEGSGEGPGEAAPATQPAAPAGPPAKRTRIFFHFKEVAGQYILKPGDEVAFVLHTNLKSGELNAQRVRRTKEAPEPPSAPEPALRPAPVPAVNPNKNKYSGNLASGTYKQPKIAKGPDGTRGFAFPRPHAIMPQLPGLEPKPEPEPEAEAEAEAEEVAAVEVAAVAAPAAEPAAASATASAVAPDAAPAEALPAAAHPLPAKHHSGVHLMHQGPHPALASAAVAVPVCVSGGSGPSSRGISPAGRLVTPTADSAAAGGPSAAPSSLGKSQSGSADVASPSWQGGTPFSALAAMTLADASAAEQGLEGLKSGGGLHTRLSADATAFVPRVQSSSSLDKHAAVAAAPVAPAVEVAPQE